MNLLEHYWREGRRLKSLVTAFIFAALSICSSISYAMEFLVSEDFDLISGSAGSLHTVRVHALAQGPTMVRISLPAKLGTPDMVATLAAAGEYGDWRVPAGSRITTDKPAFAVKYDSNRYPWNESLSGTGLEINVSGAQYSIVAASSDATNVSIDLDDSGTRKTINLNAGYALMVYSGAGKNISATKDVTVFTFDAGSPAFTGAYLLTPGTSSYAPLYAITPHEKLNDIGETGAVQSSLIRDNGILHRFARLSIRVISGIFSLIVSDAHAAASSETNVNNGNGTFTFTQTVNGSSTAPHYTKPSHGGGFGVYSWYNQDFGWKHTFPYSAQPGLQLTSVSLTVMAYDIDAEPYHGYEGEYDGIKGDGSWLNPQYLQGTNGTDSITNFNVDPSALYDGLFDVAVDIDMHHNWSYWATTLHYSQLKIVYSYTSNKAPYSPTLFTSPTGCTYTDNNLSVTVTGPAPADPDGDSVTYEYRWLVDIGTGNYIDDEFAGRGNHTGNTVPAADTQNGDKWKVEVTPIDEHGARGSNNSVSFATIGQCNTPPISNAGSNTQVPVNAPYQFDGSASLDPDGSIVSYKWELYAGGNWTTFGSSVNAFYTFNSPGTYTVRLTVTDNQGAVDDALVYVTVVANQAPTADAGADRTIESTGPTTQATLDGSGSSDPDGDSLTFVWTGVFGTASGMNPDVALPPGSHAIRLTVDDGKGHFTIDTVNIIVVDSTPPALTGLADQVLEATSASGASGTFSVTATDLVTPVPVVVCTPASGSTFAIGTTTVSCTATDGAGNSASGSFTVTVQDTVPPVVTPPADMTVEAVGLQTTVTIGTATASDAVGIVSISSNAPATFSLGKTEIIWTATDASGNTGKATQTVTVVDSTPPALTGLADQVLEAASASGASGTFSVTATDLVTPAPVVVCTPASGSTFAIGTTTVFCTATDAAENSASGSFTVTVQDTVPPVVTPPADMTVEAVGLQTTVTIGTATASDAVGIISISSNAPATFPLGKTEIIWTATDASGNTGKATQTVTVVDSTPPALTGLADQVLEATSASGASGTFSVTATDLVTPAPVVVCTPASGSTFAIGTTTVSCTATDGAGNSASGSFTVTVKDTTAPIIVAPMDLKVEATGPETFVKTGTATATDTVGVVSITSNSTGSFPLGTTVVIWTALDAAGNKATATQRVIVVDTTPPVLSLPVDQVVEAASAKGAIGEFRVSAKDLVNPLPMVICTPASGSIFAIGTTTVSCTATDKSGNSSSGSFTVKVQDTTPPVLKVPAPIHVLLNTSPTAAAIQTFLAGAYASDKVDENVTITYILPSLTSVGLKMVIFISTDDYGNRTEDAAAIYVNYGINGFLPPVSLSKPINLGSTIPVKFQLTDANGMLVTTATAKFLLQQFSNNEPVGEPIEVTSTSGADSGNTFRLSDSMYIFNLNTKALTVGLYQIQAVLDDGSVNTTWLSLK